MKRLFVMLAVAFSASFASAEIANPAIIGSWKSNTPIYAAGDLSISLGLTFNADSTANAATICTYTSGKVLEAFVTVPVEVTADTITVTGSANKQVEEGGYTCSVEISPGTVGYTLNQTTLTISQQGQTVDFSRR